VPTPDRPLAPAVCHQCGFSYGDTTPAKAAARIARSSGAVAGLLRAPSARLAVRPGPAVWSPLEYGCHLRDVHLVQRDRLVRALVEDDPHFPPMYRDERVGLARYAGEDPGRAADGLELSAGLLLWLADGLTPAQLARPCRYNLPQVTAVDVGWVLVHTAHEAVHHEDDVRRGLAAG
jgi:S-DNA-T family DNA segregation ATPase FtsK/SpoIIIE